ncbi:MAG: hypothetical protein Q8P30_02600 [Candidatus Uhrbacteria bacterium]|nr:hypothetical protein [Candidatus Uhrbacteria bacterium]
MTRTNRKMLMTINYALSIALPLTVLLVFGLWYEDFVWYSTIYGEITRWTFILMSLPITIIYSWIVLSEFFPTKAQEIILLFVPITISIIYNVLKFDSETWIINVIAHATLFYIGLNLCMIVGVLYLSFKKMYESKNDILARIATLLAILALAIVPLIYFFELGRGLYVPIQSASITMNSIVFVVSIILVTIVYYPKLVSLFMKGKL